MTKHSSISVVIPNYNHAKYLNTSLGALIGQVRLPDEIIFIDDASTDNSLEIAEKFSSKFKSFKIIRNKKNLGVIANLNKGLQLAHGDLIYFASSDDRLTPKFLKLAMEATKIWPRAAVISALNYYVDESGQFDSPMKSPVPCTKTGFISPQKARAELLRHGCWITGITAVYRRDKLVEIGGFPKELHSVTDSMTAALLALQYGAVFIPEFLAYYRKSNFTYSSLTPLDREISREILEYTEKICNETHRHLVPKDYYRRFHGRWRYVEKTSQLNGQKINDKIKLVLYAYYFFRYRKFDIFPAVSRRLLHLILHARGRPPYENFSRAGI